MNIKTITGSQIREMFYNEEFFDVLEEDIDGNELLGFSKNEALQTLNAFCILDTTIGNYIQSLLISNNSKIIDIMIYWRYLIDAKNKPAEIQQAYKIIRNMLMIGAITHDSITQDQIENLNFNFQERFFKFKTREIFWTGLVEYYYSKYCNSRIIPAPLIYEGIEILDRYFGFKIQNGNLIKYQDDTKMDILKQKYPRACFKNFQDETINPIMYGNSEVFDQIEFFWEKMIYLAHEATGDDMYLLETIPHQIEDIWKTLIIREIPINFKYLDSSNKIPSEDNRLETCQKAWTLTI